MIGATTPFFTALLGFLISGTRETPKVYLTLVPVVVGVMISTGGEPQFHLLGLIVCLLSTAARALKSVMQGLLMSNPEEKLDSVNLLRFMAPAALLMLLPLTLIFEDVERIAGFFSPASNPKHLSFSLLLLLNSLCAFFVNLLNFFVRTGGARRRRPLARAAAARSRAPPPATHARRVPPPRRLPRR